MYFHVQEFINEIAQDEPDPAAANALQEGLGGQFGELRVLIEATAAMEMADIDATFGRMK